MAVPIYFPHPAMAHESGILAFGGDLGFERLLLAYHYGIFPWFNPDDEVIWWHPDPRCVIFPERVRVAKSMRPYFNQEKYRVTYNTCFDSVIKACRDTYRPGQPGTWITDDFISAYGALYAAGHVISVEVWQGEALVGGLYGVRLGRIFYGESMFSKARDASKFGFISLCRRLASEGCVLIDCQIETPHLRSLGAELIPRDEFLAHLAENRKIYLAGL